jgi:hypothetical protein
VSAAVRLAGVTWAECGYRLYQIAFSVPRALGHMVNPFPRTSHREMQQLGKRTYDQIIAYG